MSKATVELDALVVRLIDAQKDSVEALKVVNQFQAERFKLLSEQYLELQTKYNNLVASTTTIVKDKF